VFTEQLYFLLLQGILPLPPKHQKNATMKLEFGAEPSNVMRKPNKLIHGDKEAAENLEQLRTHQRNRLIYWSDST